MRKHRRSSRRKRPGSVMIMVVALLVLLALMGTAWIASVRFDRVSSAQSVTNNQIDTVAQGVAGLLSDIINGGVWGHDEINPGNSFYRPRSDALYLDQTALNTLGSKSYSFYPYDCPIGDATAVDTNNVPLDWIEQHAGDFLASRLPEVRDPKVNNIVYWPAISAPLGSPAHFSGTSTLQKVPTIGNDSNPPKITSLDALRWYESPVALYDSSNVYHRVAYARRVDMRPAFVTVTGSDGVTRTYPVFDLTNNMVVYDADTLKSFTPKSGAGFPQFVVAADADGDGIPDSGLSRLPIGQQGGITYYASVRVIDNNAALNANIAWQWRSGANKTNADNASSFIPTNITPVNINAEALLLDPNNESYDPGGNKAGTWNTYRFNGPLNNSVFSSFNDQGSSGGFSYISYYDALWTQLGARVENPGQVASGIRYRAFPLGDHASLASRFLLVDPNAAGMLEQMLPTSLSYTRWVANNNFTLIRSTPYASTGKAGFLDYLPILDTTNSLKPAGWFADNFDFDAIYHTGDPTFNRRPLFVTRNGVTNFIAAAMPSPDGIAPGNGMLNYGPAGDPLPVKANINTGTFEELRRAFWNVMVGRVGDGTSTKLSLSPFGDSDQTDAYLGTRFSANPSPKQDDQAAARFSKVSNTDPQRMFRRSIRPPSNKDYTRYDTSAQLEIRAGLAAANAMSLRGGPGNALIAGNFLTTHSFVVTSRSNSANYLVACYGCSVQPYISEIYASNDNVTDNGGKNVMGYIAVELVNPYPFDLKLDGNWKVAYIDRSKFPQLKVTDLSTVGSLSGVTIPAAVGGKYGYAVLHNFKNGTSNSAVFVPPAALAGQGTIPHSFYIQGLHEVLGNELVLLRQATAVAGDAASGWAPVDSFDFSGFPLIPVSVAATTTPAVPAHKEVTAWHYVRANDKARHAWCFVYPGRYDGALSNRRQQGTQAETYNVQDNGQPDLQDPGFVDKWAVKAANGVTINLGDEDAVASIPENDTFTIQVANITASQNTSSFPFGGFARNGDILQVPFIGSYRIYKSDANGNAGDLLEINSISMDSVFAEDTDQYDDDVEQVGRFCPVCPNNNDGPNDLTNTNTPNDWDNTVNGYNRWRYRWAMRLFDYLTVQDANRDTFPNAPPELSANLPFVSNVDPLHPKPNPSNDLYERNVPVQGLLNINTTPELLLRTVPMAYKSGGDLDPNTNFALAKAIASYRDGDTRVNAQGNFINAPPHGPFRTIYDLYRVPAVWTRVQAILTGPDPTAADGEFTAQSPNPDGVRKDFEERFLFLNRISNMVTTRSDSFTAYVLVQGWRDAGTPNATLVSQKRLGFIIDRSNLSAKNKKPRMIPFAAR